MQRSAQRRSPTALRKRRIIAVGSVVLVVGAMLTVTQISNAGTGRWGFWGWNRHDRSSPCPTSRPTHRWDTRRDLATSEDGVVENHAGDGQSSNAGSIERASRERGRQWRRHRDRDCTPSPGTSSSPGDDDNGGGSGGDGSGGAGTVPPGGADGNNNGLDILGRDCSNSQLDIHTGFQNGNQCVQTEFGEVSSAEDNPSLLITEHPDSVAAGEAFSFTVSTRNLVRDRFLGAAAGGYYLESAFLDENGLTRGHFHNTCRLLQSTDEAPNPEPAPQFFVATEDGGGSAQPDSVQINVSGLTTPGTYQCASWAGDGTHRIPMMARANQMPAFDAFRLEVQ